MTTPAGFDDINSVFVSALRHLMIESEDRFYPPVVKHIDQVILIGLVIWAWREFKYR